MVTYADLFQYSIVIFTVLTFVYIVANSKKKK